MKNVAFTDTGRQIEFRPNAIAEKYFKLTESDVKREFKNKKKLISSNCPACKSPENKKAFVKFGFQYVECQNCRTVYMNPHPDDKDIKEHFLSSPSARFWRYTLLKATGDIRKEKIYYPRIQWIIDMAEEYLSGPKNIADFNSRSTDYIAYLLSSEYFHNRSIINPYFSIDDIEDEKLKSDIFEASNPGKSLTNKNPINIATAFEVIDCTSDVDALMKTMKSILCKGGLCFITTLSISGFDMQVLWENSKSIFPPDRINALSQKGLKLLFQRHGFEMLEYSTPGVLDLDIVEREYNKRPSLNIPRFVKSMLETGDEQLKQDFQNFLQSNRLSSFVRIALRKT